MMASPTIVSRDEWFVARKELLELEKELTRQRDKLNTARRQLPMVGIEKDYVFEGPDGNARLIDIFEDRRQLIIYHFMFDPAWSEGCTGCTAWADQIARGHLMYLHTRETTLALVSRAPISQLESYKTRMGWNLPWYSSYGSDFNYDFGVTVDEKVAPAAYNYRTRKEHEEAGTGYYFDGEQPMEQHGISCFLRDGQDCFHTYSTFGRGVECAGGASYLLDLTALGRQEAWEKPNGRAAAFGVPVDSPLPPS